MNVGKTAQGFRAKPIDAPDKFKQDWELKMETTWNFFGSTAKHEYQRKQTSPSVTDFQGRSGTTKSVNTWTFEILNALEQFADVEEAKMDTAEQLEIYEDTERQVVQEVIEAYYNYNAALIKLRSASVGLDYKKRR